MKFLVIMVWAIMWQAQNANGRDLNLRVDRLTRVTNVLQEDVNDIWTIITNSGIEDLEFGNPKRTDNDDFEQKGNGAIEKGNETMNEVKELKTVVKQFILHSRTGFKNEKEFQRKAINDLKGSWNTFKGGVTRENTRMKQKVDRLDNQMSDIQDTNKNLQETSKNLQEISKNNQLQIENVNLNLQETGNKVDTHGVFLDSLLKEVESLKVKQNTLEMENRELKQIISNIKSDPNRLPPTIECGENWTLFNGHCYKYVMEKQSFDNALETCRAEKSYLVEINTESEFAFITRLLSSEIIVRGLWIGATDRRHEGRFVYHHSNDTVPDQFWNEGEPNDNYGKEDCVQMLYIRGDKVLPFLGCHFYFNDNPCELETPFLCEKNGIAVAE